MRFSSSFVAFACLGFAAAIALPNAHTKPTSVGSNPSFPAYTPDLSARDGPKSAPLPIPSGILPGAPGKGGNGGKKGDGMARRYEDPSMSYPLPSQAYYAHSSHPVPSATPA